MHNNNQHHTTSVSGGAMTAVWFLVGATCSYFINHSVFWAILHGFCGFFYVVYLCFGCGGGFDSVDRGLNDFLNKEETSQPAQ